MPNPYFDENKMLSEAGIDKVYELLHPATDQNYKILKVEPSFTRTTTLFGNAHPYIKSTLGRAYLNADSLFTCGVFGATVGKQYLATDALYSALKQAISLLQAPKNKEEIDKKHRATSSDPFKMQEAINPDERQSSITSDHDSEIGEQISPDDAIKNIDNNTHVKNTLGKGKLADICQHPFVKVLLKKLRQHVYSSTSDSAEVTWSPCDQYNALIEKIGQRIEKYMRVCTPQEMTEDYQPPEEEAYNSPVNKYKAAYALLRAVESTNETSPTLDHLYALTINQSKALNQGILGDIYKNPLIQARIDSLEAPIMAANIKDRKVSAGPTAPST